MQEPVSSTQYNLNIINTSERQTITKRNQWTNDPIKQTFRYTQLLTQIQKYNLKSNLLSTNLNKKDYQFYSSFYLQKVNKKYSKPIQKFEHLLEQIKCQLKIAQANQFRALNNVFRTYLRRVKLLNNTPITHFKYGKFDRQEKLLMQHLILKPYSIPSFQNKQKFNQLQKQLINKNIIAQKDLSSFHQNISQLQPPKQIIDIITSCEIHCQSEFSQFQNSIVNVEKTIQSAFQQLHSYWNKFELITTKMTLNMKTQREKDIDDIIKKQEENNFQHSYEQRGGQYEYQRQNEKNNNFLYSAYNQRYISNSHFPSQPHMLNQFQNSNRFRAPMCQKNQQKPQITKKTGQMFNKKKGKSGILANDKKSLQLITNWWYNADGQQKQFSVQQLKQNNDKWKGFYQNQKDKNKGNSPKRISYQHKGEVFYESLSSSAYNSIDSLINRIYPQPEDIQSLYYYDQYGSNNNFNIIHPLSNLIQNRLLFEVGYYNSLEPQFSSINQIQEQNQKKVDKIMQKNRKQTDQFRIGFKKVSKLDDKLEIQKFIKDGFDQQFLPQVINLNDTQSYDSQDSLNNIDQIFTLQQMQSNQIIQNLKMFSNYQENPIEKIKTSQQNLLKIQKQCLNNKIKVQQNQKIIVQNVEIHNISVQNFQPKLSKSLIHPTHQNTFLSSFIQGYFGNIQTKYSRIAKQQKILKTFYFSALSTISWEYLHAFTDNIGRFFIILQQPNILLIRMQKYYNLQKQLIKCIIYQFENEINEIQRQFLKKKIKSSMFQNFIVTFNFKFIDTTKIENSHMQQVHDQNSSQNKEQKNALSGKSIIDVQCLFGMLIVLIYEQKIEQSGYKLQDFVLKGRQLINEFESFVDENKQNHAQNYNEFIKFDSCYYSKLSQINYVFDLQNDEGIVFEKLSALVYPGLLNQPLQVFKVKKFNINSNKTHSLNQSDQQQNQNQQNQDQQNQQEQNQQEQDQQEQNRFFKLQQNGKIKFKINKSNNKQMNEQHIQREKDQQYRIKNKIQQQKQDSESIHKISSIINFNTSIIRDNNQQRIIKRSNSRQQLHHIHHQNLFFQIKQNYTQQNYSQLNTKQQQQLLFSQKLQSKLQQNQQHQQNQQIYQNQQNQQIYSNDSDQQIISIKKLKNNLQYQQQQLYQHNQQQQNQFEQQENYVGL